MMISWSWWVCLSIDKPWRMQVRGRPGEGSIAPAVQGGTREIAVAARLGAIQ